MFKITWSEPGLTKIPQYAPFWHKKPTKAIMKGTVVSLTNITLKYSILYL